MTPLRCPRCRHETPELTAFCPACGAPLLLGDEEKRGTLDAPLDLDRRGGARGAGDATGGAPPVAIPGPAADVGPFRAPPPARNVAVPTAAPPVRNRVAPTGPPTSSAVPSPRPSPPLRGGEGERLPTPPTSTSHRTPTPTSTPHPAPSPSPSPSAAPATRPSPPLGGGEGESLLDALPDADVDALEIHLTRAASWRRALAWVVDGVPFVAGGGALGWSVLREAAAGRIGTAPGVDELLLLVERERTIALSVAAAVALALVTYATLAHALAGATLGKRLLGIRVVGPDGAPPTFARSALRSLLAAASIALLGAGFLLALFTRTGRALHDLIARTWVVKAP